MTGSEWKFTVSPEDAWDAMYKDCAEARSSIDLEQYIFNYDEVGKRFLELFLKKATEGVRVRLLLDAAGSFFLYNSDIPDKLAQSNIETRFFNPISPWTARHFLSWYLRDHRKLLIIDSEIGYTGGVGLNHNMKGWRDTQIKIKGPVVWEMEDSFERMWLRIIEKKFLKFRRSHSVPPFMFLTNSPHFRERFYYHTFLRAIEKAQKYVYLTTPYFVPDVGFFRALKKAAKRGVDVRILLSGHSDHRPVDTASRSYFGLALRSGARIFRYNEKVLHAKTAVIDDRWAALGSVNLDNLSFYFNYEGNLVGEDGKFAKEIYAQFIEDLKGAEEVTAESWRARPVSQKILEVFTWPIHKFL